MKKKILSLLLIALLVCALLPATALAADTVENVSTFSFAAGVTTQEDIDEKLGAGAIELTQAEVNGEMVYTLKLLKNIKMKSGCDFRINEYNVGGMSLPPVVLNLNGCTITSGSIGLITDGKLTIEDSASGGGITYSTTSDKSSLVAISNGGELIINGGTFRCESGYAFTGYVAAVSTQTGTAVINGGTFYSNSSAVLCADDGVTTVNGGSFNAPYGLYSKSGENGRGEIIVPADSTAVVDAGSFAMVIQRDDGVDGKITVEGGTFNASGVVGGVRQPDTVEAVSVAGGSFKTDPQDWVTDGTPVAQLTQSGTTGQFLVGQSVIGEAAAGLTEDDEIEVLSGDLSLTGLPDGVTVTNSGDGEVTANGESVTDVPVTTHTHVWGQPAWTWNADNTAKATFTCEKDSAHQETVTASVTSQVEKEPGCEEPGETVYTATVEWGGQTYTDSKRVETAATGHTPGEAVKENEVAATCEKEGSYDSVVYCASCAKELSREPVSVPATGHTPGEAVKENEVAATCGKEGSYESVVYCASCSKELSRELVTVPKTEKHAEGVLNGDRKATCTEEGYTGNLICPVCGTVLEKGEVIAKTAHAFKDGVCTVCGAKDPEYVVFTPEIIKGAGSTWQKGGSGGLSFTSNAAFSDFLKVQVDGKDLAAANYEVKEGSTVVTLKASYLETLAAGRHTLSIVSSSGTATTTFTVTAATTGVQTGDSGAVVLWAVLAMLGAGGAMLLTVRKKRTEQ